MCGAVVSTQAVYIDTGDCVMHVLSLEERHLWHKCVVQWLEHSLCTVIRGGCVIQVLSLEESSLRHKCVVQWLVHSLCTVIRGGCVIHVLSLEESSLRHKCGAVVRAQPG